MHLGYRMLLCPRLDREITACICARTQLNSHAQPIAHAHCTCPLHMPIAHMPIAHARCDNLEISEFSLDRWEAIVTYKTAFYSFYLSVAFAMTYAGITDQKAYDSARVILIKMGGQAQGYGEGQDYRLSSSRW